jgi:DNA modification methylase
VNSRRLQSAPTLADAATRQLRHAGELDIEPLDATFRNSERAPLHSWFPYLEGYSPRFVEGVQREYLAGAKRILDPFAGSGTTPIVLGQAGIACAYSEVNPAMAFIVRTKLAVLRLDKRRRHELARRLEGIACELQGRVKRVPPDSKLRNAYVAAFGDSMFFDESSLDEVLRLRCLNDEVTSREPLAGDCLTLAILASLIPASRLERAGDLRFKTAKELDAGLPLPVDAVRRRLLAQAAELPDVPGLRARASFVCDTAATLHKGLDSSWDGVITSPPYLNGTNYIRNARLELWYLREVATKADLRRLRDRVVTSGINDVDANTQWAPVSAGVERVVDVLSRRAYDSRIARMVGGYFRAMSAVFSSLSMCLRDGARVCVDTGDSIYAGVHVPTDDLLVGVAEDLGFQTVERLHLRKRISKNGQPLRQQLLVFEKPSPPKTKARPRAATAKSGLKTPKLWAAPNAVSCRDWRPKWEVFKAALPHREQPFAKREWGGPAHSMCSYQGKLKPSIAHHLVSCFSSPGDVVVDPFSGAGTIPFEACRMERRGFGIDISRLGYVLTLAKVERAVPERTTSLLDELEDALDVYRLSPADFEGASAVRFNSSVPDYFHHGTLREVLAARRFFLSRWDSGPEWALLLACTLHLLHGNRPYALSRRSHPVTPFKPTGPAEYRALLPRLRAKLERLGKATDSGSTRGFGGSALGDCTTRWPVAIPRADAIITSPPFFDSTRFYMTNWMRFWFAGWEREDFIVRTKPFVENRQKENLDVYRAFFEFARERLSATGLLVLHLGKSSKCDMGVELAKRVAPWFSVEDNFTEAVQHCESHGIRDKGAVHGHSYLVLAPK